MAIMAASCSGNKGMKADLVIINGKVFTVDRDKPLAEAVAVRGDTIIAVCSAREISSMIVKGKPG